MRYRPLQVALLGWRESRRRSSRPTRPSRRCKATKKTWTRWQPRVLFDQCFWISSSCYLFTRYMNIWCIAQVFLSWCHLQVNKWNGTPILLTLGLSPSWLRLRNLYLQQCILFTGVPSCCRLSFPFLSFVKSKCHGQARTAKHFQGERMKKAKEAVPWRSQWSFATLCFCFPVASRIPNCDQTKMWFLPFVSRWKWHHGSPEKSLQLNGFEVKSLEISQLPWNLGKSVSTSPSKKINHETIPKHTGSAPTEAAKET